MSAAVMAIGGVFAGAGATAAATASIGATVLGSVISGAATAWSAASERKAREKFERQQDIDEEERNNARYEGVADAADFWNDPTASRLGDPQDPALGLIGRLGKQGQVGRPTERIGRRPDQVGSAAMRKIKAQAGTEPKPPKYSYDATTRMIQINS